MIKVNKSQWKTYKFGDIASNISERAEPKDTKLNIYVGLEHLDPDCIHIRRKGHPSDVKGTKLRVYPGDIIFGKRRAYQRKAAIVDFDGICSAHAMVVRANSKVILPELLPHFMHSDVFMHRAVDVSEGSLSPTIKWKILSEQPFRMPPIDDQKHIADLLWSIDTAIEKNFILLKNIETVRLSSEKKYFNKSNGNTVELAGVIEKFISGGTPSTKNKDYWENGRVPWITTRKMDNFYVSDGEKYITDVAVQESNTKIVNRGNILFGTRVGVGKCSKANIDLAINQDVTGLQVNQTKIDPEYLFYQLISDFIQSQVLCFARGTTVKGITRQDLKTIKIVLNSDQQKEIGMQFQLIWNMKNKINKNTEQLKTIYKRIVNQIFA